MKRKLPFVLIAFVGLSVTVVFAQESRFFMPVEIQKAYENHTRSYDGRPGADYWQNTADYNIKVSIIPGEKRIEGHENVIYHNNSPDEINKLVVRLYGDVFKLGNPRLYPVYKDDITEGVELREVIINGTPYNLDDSKIIQQSGTNISFKLQKPLKPGSDLSFSASWKQKIPAYTKIRTGAYDSTAFFIGYWYPQIAVYDDIFGWDELDYLFRTEFYNNLAYSKMQTWCYRKKRMTGTDRLKIPDYQFK